MLLVQEAGVPPPGSVLRLAQWCALGPSGQLIPTRRRPWRYWQGVALLLPGLQVVRELILQLLLQLLIPLCLSGRCPYYLCLQDEDLLRGQPLRKTTQPVEPLLVQTTRVGRGAAQGFGEDVLYC